MSFDVYLKKDVSNEIANKLNEIPDKITVSSLTIVNGLLQKGNYYIPIGNILFIKEV